MATPAKIEKRFELAHGRRFTVIEKAEGAEHGFVTGFAIVSTIDGADYYDTQGEHVPVDVAEAAAIEFMKAGGDGKIMHAGAVAGRIVESFVITKAKAAALGWPEPAVEGWVISFAPATADVKKRFTSGELAGFSIAGTGWVIEEEVAA